MRSHGRQWYRLNGGRLALVSDVGVELGLKVIQVELRCVGHGVGESEVLVERHSLR